MIAIDLWGVMSERFLKFIPSEEAFWLMHNKPNAFRLLTHIANTARRKNGHPDGLLIGQCHLEHWSKYKLSESKYRTAKKILILRKHILITETNRTRQKSTTGMTTESTLVQLLSSTVYDINPESDDDRNDDRMTTGSRLDDDKQEGIRKIKKEKEKENVAQSAPPLRTKKESIFFNFESFQFEGISDQDRKDWSAMYPHVNLDLELTKASQWLKANPTKSNKKLWRKFLIGWFTRTNDSAENKKAFKASGSFGLPVDRRTQNMDGTPMKSKAEGMF